MLNSKLLAIFFYILTVLSFFGCASLQQQKEVEQEKPEAVPETVKNYSINLFFKDTSSEEIAKTLEDIINKKRNILIIKSSGGNVSSAMAFYDTIRNVYKKELTVIGVGQISSSAIILFCTGEKRLVGKNSFMLLHSITTSYGTKNPTTKDKKEGDDQKIILENLYAKIISETTKGKLSPERVKAMMNKSTTLTAPEIVKFGIATDILDENSL